MKNLFVFCLTIMTFTSFAYSNVKMLDVPDIKIESLFHKLTLTAGSIIFLETNEAISSRNLTVGQLIQFKVRTNVFVNGKIVIKSGAMATGRVKTIEKASYNSAEEVKIEVNSVLAVDGQQIQLNGLEQSLKGRYPGEGFTIEAGTKISATVMNDIKIKVK